jgi:2-polyprenyl-3-methyl-5-hydroxy-6-metoxy-1,4-benzoquinol methylase
MSTSTPKRTQEYFEQEAADFDAAYAAPGQIKDFVRRVAYIYNRKPIEGRQNALVELAGDVRDKKILEAGCGPGFYSIRLAKAGARVTALDYAQGMVDIARRNAAQAGVDIDFLVGDINYIEIPNTFDITFATGVIEYISPAEHIAFLKRMAALANEHVIASFPKKGILHAFIRNIWLSRFKQVKVTFFTNDDIRRLSREAGLVEVDRRDVGILWVVKFAHASR